MRRLLLVLCLLGLAAQPSAQSNTVNSGASLPTGCVAGSVYITTGTPTLYVCAPANTWTAITWNGALPSGAIIWINSGACPTGFTEVSALNGKIVRGTLNANGDVGGTGGNDSYTPAGTISALTFTGTAWSAPAIAWPAGVPTFTGTGGTVPAQTFTGSSATTSAVSGGTPAGTNGASATTGNCAATNIAAGTGSTTACKATAPALTVTAQTFTGSALATHTHTLTATGTNGTAAFTPAGTVAWPAGVPTIGAYTPAGTINTPTFTGTAATVIPAYLKLIGCSKS